MRVRSVCATCSSITLRTRSDYSVVMLQQSKLKIYEKNQEILKLYAFGNARENYEFLIFWENVPEISSNNSPALVQRQVHCCDDYFAVRLN